MNKKTKEEIVKKLEDALIEGANLIGNRAPSLFALFHEVEKPECLKRLARERMQEHTKK